MAAENLSIKNADKDSLLRLDDYSLLHVISYLRLVDQFHLAKVNRHFEHLMHTVWSKHLTYFVIAENIFSSNAEYAECMALIQPHVKHLKIHYIKNEILCRIYKYVFPNVYYIDFHAVWDISDAICGHFDDGDVKIIAQMFPNVTKLRFWNWVVRADDLFYFRSLKDFELKHDGGFEEGGLHQVLATKQLKRINIMDSCIPYRIWGTSLSHINLKACHLEYDGNLRTIMEMPSLQTLSVLMSTSDGRIWSKIIKRRKRKIIGLKYNGPLRDDKLVTDISELEELVLQNHDMSDRLFINNKSLISITENLKHLRVLHVAGSALENELGLLHVIENCQNLTLLDISYTQLDEGFIVKVVSILKRQKTRTQPLTIWIRGTQIDKTLVKLCPSKYWHRMLITDTKSCLHQHIRRVLKLSFGELMFNIFN